MTAPTILIEVLLNGAWTDISGYVQLRNGIVLRRGRQNEQATPEAGTLTFSLNNKDGRFTTGRPLLADGVTSNPHYPHFTKWAQVRYSLNGTRRFTGYISSAPTMWNSRSAALPDVPVTCTDLLGMMRISPVANSWASELISSLLPIYWWPMNDAPGSTSAAAAEGGIPMTAFRYAGGTAAAKNVTELVEFGVNGEAAVEADTQVTLKSLDTGTALQNGNFTVTIPTALPQPFTLLLTLTANQLPKTGTIFSFTSSGLKLTWSRDKLTLSEGASSTTFDSSLILAPGKPSIIAVTVASSTVSIHTSAGGSPGIFRPVAGAAISGPLVLGGSNIEDAEFTYSNVAILDYLFTDGPYSALVAKMLGQGVSSISDWLGRACKVAGYTGAVSTTTARQMERPPLKGSNPGDIGDIFSRSVGGMFVVSPAGVPTWIDPSYCPALVGVNAAILQTGLTWAADQSQYYTDVTVDGVTKATVAGFPRAARDIAGLLPDASQNALVAWLAATADAWSRERLDGFGINLTAADSTKTAAWLALDLRSRLQLTGLPASVPDPGVVTLEGFTDTVTLDSWIIAINTAPDPRFVLGESLLGSDYRLGWE